MSTLFSRPPFQFYTIALYGHLYYEEESFFGDGSVHGYSGIQCIEARCSEEAKNVYRIVNEVDCEEYSVNLLGIATPEVLENICSLSFKDRPKSLQKPIYHSGDLDSYFRITDKQWVAISHLSKATGDVFNGLTKIDASSFISSCSEKVRKYKQTRFRNYHSSHRDYSEHDTAVCEELGLDISDMGIFPWGNS